MKINIKQIGAGFISIFIGLLIWQFIAFLWKENILPAPIDVFTELINLFKEQGFINDLFSSFYRVVIGFSIATILGVFFGIMVGLSNSLNNFFRPIIELLRPIPPIAYIPIAILWFGLGDIPAFFLVFIAAFFPIFSNTSSGVKSIDEKYKKAAITLGANNKDIIVEIILPHALPGIFTGLKTGLGMAWMAVIAAEMMGAQSGLGYFIQMNRIVLDLTRVLAGMLMIGLIGALLHLIICNLERQVITWKKT